jgi:competence protein ComEC
MHLDKLRMFKTEAFFLLCLISSVLTAGNLYAQIAVAVIIPAVFLSRRAYILVSSSIIILMLIINFTVLVVDEKTVRKETISYETTRGTVVVPINTPLKAGEAVIGVFTKENLQGKEGRFARGFLNLNKIYYRTQLPFVSWILEKRKKVSEELYLNSAGKLTLIQALLMGNTSYLEKPIQDVYLHTGLTHLLSVSGSHVGVVTLICFTALFFLPLKVRMIFACFALLAFIPLAGFKVPVMRSAISAIIVMLAWLIDNKTDLRKFVLFLWGVFLLIAPTLLGNISFLLSFTAIYGIASLNYRNTGWLEGAVKVGMVATAFTMPLSMFVFGTFSIASIFTTMIMVPVVYFQLITGFFYMIFPSLFLEPLILLESVNIFAAEKLAYYLGGLFVFKYINVYIFAGLTLFLFAISFTRYVLLSALVYLAVLLPSYMPDGLYFPELDNYRAFVYKEKDRIEVFFSGMHSSYMYSFLPFVAKFGTTTFDHADINIYNGKNTILKKRYEDSEFSKICVNDTECTKPLIYMTRSNTIRKKNIRDEKTYFLLKNNFKSENIIELNERTPLIYDFERKVIR